MIVSVVEWEGVVVTMVVEASVGAMGVVEATERSGEVGLSDIVLSQLVVGRAGGTGLDEVLPICTDHKTQAITVIQAIGPTSLW